MSHRDIPKAMSHKHGFQFHHHHELSFMLDPLRGLFTEEICARNFAKIRKHPDGEASPSRNAKTRTHMSCVFSEYIETEFVRLAPKFTSISPISSCEPPINLALYHESVISKEYPIMVMEILGSVKTFGLF